MAHLTIIFFLNKARYIYRYLIIVISFKPIYIENKILLSGRGWTSSVWKSCHTIRTDTCVNISLSIGIQIHVCLKHYIIEVHQHACRSSVPQDCGDWRSAGGELGGSSGDCEQQYHCPHCSERYDLAINQKY